MFSFYSFNFIFFPQYAMTLLIAFIFNLKTRILLLIIISSVPSILCLSLIIMINIIQRMGDIKHGQYISYDSTSLQLQTLTISHKTFADNSHTRQKAGSVNAALNNVKNQSQYPDNQENIVNQKLVYKPDSRIF